MRALKSTLKCGILEVECTKNIAKPGVRQDQCTEKTRKTWDDCRRMHESTLSFRILANPGPRSTKKTKATLAQTKLFDHRTGIVSRHSIT